MPHYKESGPLSEHASAVIIFWMVLIFVACLGFSCVIVNGATQNPSPLNISLAVLILLGPGAILWNVWSLCIRELVRRKRRP